MKALPYLHKTSQFGKKNQREKSSAFIRKQTNSNMKSQVSENEESVASKITLPKNLYKSNLITKDNKTQWEEASRKLRAIIPIFTKINNTETRKELKRRESKRSMKSTTTKKL